MENLVLKIIDSGNALAIVVTIFCCAFVYLVIYFQRKSTSASRESQIQALDDKYKDKINKLEIEKELMQKDISYLKDETSIVKADIKDIKETLNQMALSLASIAAKYQYKSSKGK